MAPHAYSFQRNDAELDKPDLISTRQPTTSHRGANRGTVLLVEDDDMVRRLIRMVLTTEGYQVLEASDAGEAFRIGHEHGGAIDLLLTDVMLPGVGGFQLAARLAVIRPSMTVLFMSGYSEDAVAKLADGASEAHFLQKPFMPSLLVDKVETILDAKKYWTVPFRIDPVPPVSDH